MEPSFELISKYRSELENLPFLKEGFSRLLYPIDQENRVTDDKDSKKDCNDEIEKSICEFVFFYNAILSPLVAIIKPVFYRETSSFLLHLKKYFRNGHYYASFEDVHNFLTNQNIQVWPDILRTFGFSTKSIIELCELQREHHESLLQVAKNEDKSLAEEEDFAPYSKESHLRFIDLIKHEDYPSLFHAVYVYNDLIPNLHIDNDFFRPLFIKKKEYTLNEWPQNFSYQFALLNFEAEKLAAEDFEHVFYDIQYFSECKFTKWVDEWDTQIDSFIKEHLDRNPFLDLKGRYLVRDRELEQVKDYFKQVLITRGWKVPNFKSRYIIDNPTKIQQLKWITGDYLFCISQVYSIVRDVLYEEERTVINWLLERTHYNTIFNKLVEYFTTKYILKDSVPDSNETVEKPSINESISIGSATPKIETKHINSNNNDLLFLRVVDEKVPGPVSQRVSIRRECLEKLYRILIERGYLDKNTDKELFIYRFTGLGEPYSKDQTICWKGVNKLLGYIARCLFTYRSSGTEGLGKFGELFEDEDGNHPYLPSAKRITLEEYNKNPDKRSYQQFKEAIEILLKCGFINVGNTSQRGRK